MCAIAIEFSTPPAVLQDLIGTTCVCGWMKGTGSLVSSRTSCLPFYTRFAAIGRQSFQAPS